MSYIECDSLFAENISNLCLLAVVVDSEEIEKKGNLRCLLRMYVCIHIYICQVCLACILKRKYQKIEYNKINLLSKSEKLKLNDE